MIQKDEKMEMYTSNEKCEKCKIKSLSLHWLRWDNFSQFWKELNFLHAFLFLKFFSRTKSEIKLCPFLKEHGVYFLYFISIKKKEIKFVCIRNSFPEFHFTIIFKISILHKLFIKCPLYTTVSFHIYNNRERMPFKRTSFYINLCM